MPVRFAASFAKPSPWARLRAVLPALLAALLPCSAVAAAASLPEVGAYVDLAAMAPPAMAAEVDRLADAGVASVRLPLDWNRVQPGPGPFLWQRDDAAVDAARARGLDVVLVLGPCAEWAVDPAWQVPADKRANSLPKSPDLWEGYVRAAVSHFRGRVTYWQVREQPNAENFRGARSEYTKLLRAAARAARAVDPAAVVVAAEAGSLDVGAAQLMARSPEWDDVGVVGLYVRPGWPNTSASALRWAVLAGEVLPSAPGAPRPAWVLGGGADMSADLWLQQYLLACAFGAARFYLPASVVSRDWLAPLAGLQYSGFLHLGPDLWALWFRDGSRSLVAAWSEREVVVAPGDIAPVSDPDALLRTAVLGGAPASAVTTREGAIALRIGPRPVLIAGLDPAASASARQPTRTDVLAVRPGPDVSKAPSVYADYGIAGDPEVGLYNRPLRTLPGGAVTEEEASGRRCLRTHMRPTRGAQDADDPWVYFDVDDRWLYAPATPARVAVTVECDGAFLGAEKLGFNIMYDSSTGYRFTKWQWVDPPAGQFRRFRVELDDAVFSGRDGYDFRINAKGSKQDLWVAAVTVEKLPPAPPPR